MHWLARQRRLLLLGILTLVGCGGDTIAAPIAAAPGKVNPGEIATPASWARILPKEELLLSRLKTRFSRYHEASDSAAIVRQSLLVDMLRHRSVSLTLANEWVKLTSKGPALRKSTSISAGPGAARMDLYGPSGDIDPNESYTRWYPTDATSIYVNTSTPGGVAWIRERTSGSYTTFDVPKDFLSAPYAEPIDLSYICSSQLPDPGEGVPGLPEYSCFVFRFSLADQIPLVADCSLYGMTMSALTDHSAGIMLPSQWEYGPATEMITGQLTTFASDNGECPRRPPTAHFVMSGGGVTANSDNGLNLTGEADVALAAQGFTRDAAIASFNWLIGGSTSTGYSTSWHAPLGFWGVELTITDVSGMQGRANSYISVQAQRDSTPPPSGGGMPTEPPPSDPTGHGYYCYYVTGGLGGADRLPAIHASLSEIGYDPGQLVCISW